MFKVFFSLIQWRNLSRGKESLSIDQSVFAVAESESTGKVSVSFAETESTGKGIAVPAGGAGGAIAPPSFEDLGKIKIFRAVRRKYLGKTVVFRAAI